MLANPPWHQLRERAQKIPGDKKHVEAFTHGVIALRSSILYRRGADPSYTAKNAAHFGR